MACVPISLKPHEQYVIKLKKKTLAIIQVKNNSILMYSKVSFSFLSEIEYILICWRVIYISFSENYVYNFLFLVGLFVFTLLIR